jgi:ubiquinone/menaquinone biosynthesis C-methylase UbiE
MRHEDGLNSMALSRPEDWERYWQDTWITSFAEQFPDNYDGSFSDFWREQLTGELEHLVDIGCGNGALAWIADELLNRPSGTVRITGVDTAAIDPFRALHRNRRDHPKVSFIGSTPAEQLPFADDSVDFVISQYGIEYTELDKTIPEIARVLKPSGRMAFIMHDAESSVVRDATRHLDDFQAVLDLRIHDYALELLQLGSRLTTTQERQASSEFSTLAAQLNLLTERVRDIVSGHAARSAIHKYMDELMLVFANPKAESGADHGARVIAVGDTFSAHVRKMAHMRTAALSAEERQQLVSLIEGAGYKVTEMAAIGYRHESNVGTKLVAVPAKSA